VTKTRPRDVPLPPPEEVVLTRLEACRVARISLPTFDKAVAEKRLTVHRNGRRITVPRAEVERCFNVPPRHAASA
jgi:excisionase family DNA binding protein